MPVWFPNSLAAFNELTGLNQHTGNWPGKTVTNAQGYCTYNEQGYILVDIPGCYSLMAHSAEEEVARDFLCFGKPDAVIVVCDATCLERNLNLVLQTLELTKRVVVCVNLMDEAEKKGVRIDFESLSTQLGVPVVPAAARSGEGLSELMQSVQELLYSPASSQTVHIRYPAAVEEAISLVLPTIDTTVGQSINPRWLALRLLEGDEKLIESVSKMLGKNLLGDRAISEQLAQAQTLLREKELAPQQVQDAVVGSIVLAAEGICCDCVHKTPTSGYLRDRKIDRFLTSKKTGFPLMLLLLTIIFWLTITGANYPSQMLSTLLFTFEEQLTKLFAWAGAPPWFTGVAVQGAYRVLAWVVSVMLPPMAIFFPLFTLLEDLGYLPRVAFNLDQLFKRCSACGKQALTMAMGLGCNAAGVIGCRIIDSPRERLIAIITNSFVPCNGRYPTLIAIIAMFFSTARGSLFGALLPSVLLTTIILLGVLMTFAVSKLLSMTVLKGVPSSFAMELPPYRKPQIAKVLVRSIFDRTLFVLARAAAVAAPAGVLLWGMANITVGSSTLLMHCASFLDPLGRFLGMDGVILLAFILGFPANEIVLPIILMIYLANGTITPPQELSALKPLLVQNGWTWITAISVMLFSLMHWPCSTTCLTIHKETQSLRWTLVSLAVPTAAGIILCAVFANIAKLL